LAIFLSEVFSYFPHLELLLPFFFHDRPHADRRLLSGASLSPPCKGFPPTPFVPPHVALNGQCDCRLFSLFGGLPFHSWTSSISSPLPPFPGNEVLFFLIGIRKTCLGPPPFWTPFEAGMSRFLFQPFPSPSLCSVRHFLDKVMSSPRLSPTACFGFCWKLLVCPSPTQLVPPRDAIGKNILLFPSSERSSLLILLFEDFVRG